MRTHATCLLLAGLSACAPLSDYEAETLAARAIVDARAQPARLHRAYLDCYALPRATKRRCIAVITPNAASRVAARSRTFATAFDHEAERLGFGAFLQANGKACASVDHGPLFDADLGAYRVECADGNHYRMRYAVETGWTLLPDAGTASRSRSWR